MVERKESDEEKKKTKITLYGAYMFEVFDNGSCPPSSDEDRNMVGLLVLPTPIRRN